MERGSKRKSYQTGILSFVQDSYIPMGCIRLILVDLPSENPNGITLTIPVGKISYAEMLCIRCNQN